MHDLCIKDITLVISLYAQQMLSLFLFVIEMPAIEFDIKPTNITSVGNRKNNGNRDSDIILYILIVVGASILLLLIPLVSYIVRWSKRKTRRRKRRRQAEKAHGNSITPFAFLLNLYH